MAKPLRDVLPSVLKHAQARSQPLQAVQARWPALVGPSLARHTKPVSLRRQVLTIQSDQPGASYTLNLLRPRLLAALGRTAAGRITELVIRAGTVST